MNYATFFLFGLALATANVIGGLLVTSSASLARNARLLRFLIALGAGFMLAAIFIEVVPATVEVWARRSSDHAVLNATTLLLAGYLLIHLFEHTIAPHFHFGAETHPERLLRPTAAYAAIGGLSIHTLFDGVSIAAAFLVNFKVGLLVFIAVLLHKVPEGFTAASIMLASGREMRRARWATLLIGGATLLGVMSVAIAQAHIEPLVAYALPFSAGVTLYVAASDLIPEVNHLEEKNPLTSVVVFIGVAFFYLLHLMIED
ncbi:ZIP family metal transporter [Pyrinomonas methylaliphatogenes]|jgi:zinc transporter ZupT|uniref:Predicted divalent heavy-metal cations transporter n=1 Tax=Pyrinomonas methylaliphatogenes TaxID=454194 RepID=A0A0B6X0M1_9BACT|nr:ZIP family metal transporter [Pyrinomonas methylaliphatogenes]MBX5480156.1 ZIP family metal transporter [Pyrinomonas methylaliphatogenes]CDM67073.1 predicted divalent heavy-metal cations transporter [Pyrinomonas methylaliphatogenes]